MDIKKQIMELIDGYTRMLDYGDGEDELSDVIITSNNLIENVITDLKDILDSLR